MTRAAESRLHGRRTLRLTKPLRDRIHAGHPWIYDRAVAPIPPDVVAGDVVTIADDEGEIALAFADPGSPIRARILAPPGTRLEGQEVLAERARHELLATGLRLNGERVVGLDQPDSARTQLEVAIGRELFA